MIEVEILAVYDEDKPRRYRKGKPEGYRVYFYRDHDALIPLTGRLWSSHAQAMREAEEVAPTMKSYDDETVVIV